MCTDDVTLFLRNSSHRILFGLFSERGSFAAKELMKNQIGMSVFRLIFPEATKWSGEEAKLSR